MRGEGRVKGRVRGPKGGSGARRRGEGGEGSGREGGVKGMKGQGREGAEEGG